MGPKTSEVGNAITKAIAKDFTQRRKNPSSRPVNIITNINDINNPKLSDIIKVNINGLYFFGSFILFFFTTKFVTTQPI